MNHPTATDGADRLLHASPHRTVRVGTDAGRGGLVVRKLVVSGAIADAERETALGRLCAGPGVVEYLGCALDPKSRRPCITLGFVDGADLDRLVAEQGALRAAFACDLLAPAAATLARLHSVRDPAAPHGVCHGDVKPKNLLRTATTTLLLDFEHAAPIATAGGSPARGDATRGDGRFRPPEPPSAAFDVFGLGATLRWLLTGGDATSLPQHPDVEALVASCCDAEPARRPAAATVAAALQDLAARLADTDDERALDAAARGAEPNGALPTRAAVAARCRHAARLRRRFPELLAVPPALPTEPAALRRELRTVARVLRHFPRHAPTLHWRRSLAAVAGRQLADAATHVAALRRAEEFEAGAIWLREATQLARECLLLPGGCPIPDAAPNGAASALQRDPLAHLQQLGEQLATAREDLASETGTIRAAEARLDLDAAARAIDATAQRFGGASPTVARHRDQLHRLSFYLERIARAQANVERVATTWDAAALQPVTALVAAATEAANGRSRSDTSTGLVGLRSLQITLVNLAEEFPHVPAVAPALAALSQALVDLTDRAWRELDDASKLLRSVPVPVRPLQAALARLDTGRVLEAFVDRPDRPRSQLQDAIEALRLRLDQARATRDRLAEGAEDALARGHWTTGLFDMERAVAELNPQDERERAEAARLEQRLAEARRRRRELDATVRRNVELSTRYGELQDDPASSFESRLQVLAARRDCLHLLTMHVPAERAALYARDLRDVETQLAQERAALAEQRLDAETDALERVRIARATVDEITAAIADVDHGGAPGRLLRLLEHWQRLATRCQDAVAEAQQRQRERARRRQRNLALVVVAVVAVVAVLVLEPWRTPRDAVAAGRGGAATAPVIDALPAGLQAAAAALASTAREPAEGTAWEFTAWRSRWRAALVTFGEAAGGDGAARAFAAACWDTALDAAERRLDAADLPALRQWTEALADELRPFGVAPSPR